MSSDVQIFERGAWRVGVQGGQVLLYSPIAAEVDGSHWRMLEVSAFDLRRALGDALDAIERSHGHTLSSLEAQIRARAWLHTHVGTWTEAMVESLARAMESPIGTTD